jgi:hypothetical protein
LVDWWELKKEQEDELESGGEEQETAGLTALSEAPLHREQKNEDITVPGVKSRELVCVRTGENNSIVQYR